MHSILLPKEMIDCIAIESDQPQSGVWKTAWKPYNEIDGTLPNSQILKYFKKLFLL